MLINNIKHQITQITKRTVPLKKLIQTEEVSFKNKDFKCK
jgi:hypothetical protein